MSEYIKLGDNVKFGVTIHHPVSGYIVNTTIDPRWLVYRNTSDTPVLSGLFTLRTGLIGTYRGNFDASISNGFATNDYVEVHASGEVDGIIGRSIVRTFVIDDIFNVNLTQISGIDVNNSKYIADKVWDERLDQHTQNVTFGSGINRLINNIGVTVNSNIVSINSSGLNNHILPVNLVEVSGLPVNISLNQLVDNIWDEKIREHLTNDSFGSGINKLVNNIGTTVNANIISINSSGLNNHILPVNVIEISGHSVINSIINTNIVQISGHTVANALTKLVDDIWDESIINHTTNNTFGSGLVGLIQNLYFAAIKFVKDDYNNQDEYVVQWFKNDSPIYSGGVINPALSVYKTSDSTALFQNKKLNYYNVNTGSLRYNESGILAVSGEPYLAITSGLIDGSLRTWANPIGIGYLSDSNGFLLI